MLISVSPVVLLMAGSMPWIGSQTDGQGACYFLRCGSMSSSPDRRPDPLPFSFSSDHHLVDQGEILRTSNGHDAVCNLLAHSCQVDKKPQCHLPTAKLPSPLCTAVNAKFVAQNEEALVESLAGPHHLLVNAQLPAACDPSVETHMPDDSRTPAQVRGQDSRPGAAPCGPGCSGRRHAQPRR